MEKIKHYFKIKQPFQQKKKNELLKRHVLKNEPRFPRIEENVAKIILGINEEGRIPKSYEVKKWAKEKAKEFYPS